MNTNIVSYILLVFLLVFLIGILSRFRPAPTQEIIEGLYALRCLIVNFYAVKTTEGVVLFDTGISAATAKRSLRKLGIEPDEVTHVFLTHTDYDHVGGLGAFAHATWYIPQAEEQMVNGQTTRRLFMHNRLSAPYQTLKDGQTVVVGDSEIQLFSTPGHTPGSASYLIDRRFLVTGDLLRITRKGAVLPFLRFMNKNHRQDIQSVEAIRPVVEEVQCLLTGHTGFAKRC